MGGWRVEVLKLLKIIRSRRTRLIRLFILVLVAWSFFAWVAARVLIVRAELAHADALAVLSGSSDYLERSRWAARLFAEGRSPKIVLTDEHTPGPWSFADQRNLTYTELEVRELVRAGVPAESIQVLPGEISSTHDEAVLLHQWATSENIRSLLVVTSAYHSRRALWTMRGMFRESGIEIGLDAPPAGQQSPTPVTWWWHGRGWRAVAGEYPKFIYYWIAYR